MLARPVSKFQYIPVVALGLSILVGGYVYNRTLDDWITDIVSEYMLGLLNDVNHEIKEHKYHFYDLTPAEVDSFLGDLSQSSTQRRFTIIHESGKVLGDSKLTKREVYNLDNYGQRPEIVLALSDGKGIAKRFSSISRQETLYVAARIEIDDPEHDTINYSGIEKHGHDHEGPHRDVLPSNTSLTEFDHHEEHSSVYILRLAMPMTSIHNMSQDLRGIVYLLMICSMGVLIASSWYSQRKITQVINEERKLQEVRINKSTREIELLRQLANMLAACTTISEAQQVVEDIVPRILGDINGCVSIMRESRNLLEIEIDWGGPWPAATSFSPDDCWAMRKGQSHLSRDDNHSLSCHHMCEADEQNMTLCIPLTAHGNTVGIFHLYFDSPHNLISEDIKQLAYTLAEHLGLALSNLRLQDKLRSQALRDPLTGLYNRRYFENKLESEWLIASQDSMPLSIIMLDLDHFKQFNDNFGHDAGDYVLKELGSLLKSICNVRNEVCRLGGEEFAVICPNLSKEKTIELTNRIIESVRELHLEVRGLSLGQLGISAGVSTYPDIDVSHKEMVKIADAALYKAKENGRSQAMHASDT
ncbi:sensor domain-containing diguanylate cyclase [Vibrio sp. RC27]